MQQNQALAFPQSKHVSKSEMGIGPAMAWHDHCWQSINMIGEVLLNYFNC